MPLSARTLRGLPTVIGPVTNTAFTSGHAGVWSYAPSSAGNHRFDNFSVTVLGGGQQRASKVLARRVLPQAALTPAPNQVFRLYYYAGNTRAAVRVLTGASGANDLYFLHGDHLGSTTMTTDLNANVVGQQRYYAYGEPRNASGTLHTDRRFTGQREENGLGSLYDYNARMYSLIGRFISADTIVPGAGKPQALNRYMFVYGNPLKYVDPSGHCRISTNSNGDDYIADHDYDCTSRDFDQWDMAMRARWVRAFMNSTGSQGWFNNIIGVLEFFEKNGLDQSSWAARVDSHILQGFQDGYAIYRGFIQESTNPGAALWDEFFTGLLDPAQSLSSADLKSRWGLAEQATTDYGVDQIGWENGTFAEQALKLTTDLYRGCLAQNTCSGLGGGAGGAGGATIGLFVCVGNPLCVAVGGVVGLPTGAVFAEWFFDPRSTVPGGYSPVYYAADWIVYPLFRGISAK